jgi:hypothetical protein
MQVAVQLYHLISEDLVPNCHDWLVHRWQAAARKDWELLRAKWMQADPQPLLELVQVSKDRCLGELGCLSPTHVLLMLNFWSSSPDYMLCLLSGYCSHDNLSTE